MSISFHSDFSINKIIKKRAVKNWIEKIIIERNKKVGEINIIVVTDEELLELNREYLKKDYYTDVICFDYNVNEKISGDIFISYDRIKENAKYFNCSLKIEFLRIIIHAIFHLLGYKDQTKVQKSVIRKMEEYALSSYREL